MGRLCDLTTAEVSRMLFRWVMEGVFETLRTSWTARSCGIQVDGSQLMCSRWANDSWLLAKSTVSPKPSGIALQALEVASHKQALRPERHRIPLA